IKFNKKLILTSNQIIFDSNVYPTYDVIYRYAHHKSNLFNHMDYEMFKLINKKEFRKNEILHQKAKKLNITFLKKTDFTCNFDKFRCKAFTDTNYPIRLDDSHVTLDGAKYLGRIINEVNWFKFK
ncbi:SGNH hydrolase domain-containing protein, partial [Candidatus Pelagibacter sp.]|nr:SGNH hydrolase domain-containing protein [Candidatus Pelagibacter sp.]